MLTRRSQSTAAVRQSIQMMNRKNTLPLSIEYDLLHVFAESGPLVVATP